MSGPKYELVAQRLAQALSKLRPGQRLPSVRALAAREGVSPATAVRAYERVVGLGLAEARPQSGHFAAPPPEASDRRPTLRPVGPRAVRVNELMARLSDAHDPPATVPLGRAVPDVVLLPERRLRRSLARAAAGLGPEALRHAPPNGLRELRDELARRSLDWGCALSPEDFVVTNGASEALSLALQAVTRAGDIVAVESPGYFVVLQLLEALGLRALEIASAPPEGLRLGELEAALARHPVRAVVAITTVSNPLGATMSDERRQALVEMLARRGIPLVEDDVWGDLAFGLVRPRVAKAFDRHDRVLLCGSCSKTLGSGLRIGWVASGRHRQAIELRKFAHTLAAPTLAQAAIADYLASGGYDTHVRRLRRQLAQQVAEYRQAVVRAFPAGTTVSRPAGGCYLWVELPSGVDVALLHARALAAGIRVMPGTVFSACGRFRRCMRVGCGQPWSPLIERALGRLGSLAASLAR